MNDKTEPWKWGDENQPKPEEPPHIEGQRHLCCGYDAYMRPFDKGNWVAYEDYAKLRMERIHDLNQIGGLQEDYARLKTEVADLKSTADRFKAEVERWEFIHRLDSLAIKKQKEEIERLNEAIVRGAIIPDPKPE